MRFPVVTVARYQSPTHASAEFSSIYALAKLGPHDRSGLYRSVHTAHYSAPCGRCGNARERRSRPEVPPGAPGLHSPVHTAHYPAPCGRCGSTRGISTRGVAHSHRLPGADRSGFGQNHYPNIALILALACNALVYKVLRQGGRSASMLGWLENCRKGPFRAILTLRSFGSSFAMRWSTGYYVKAANLRPC